MQDLELTFELFKIKEAINEYARSETGRNSASNLMMLENKESVVKELNYLKETMSIIQRFGVFPIASSADALRLLELARKTSILTPRDLNLIAEDILTSQKIIKYFQKVGEEYPLLKEKISQFNDLDNLEKEIRRVITNSLTIDDNATSELKAIRGKIKRLEAQLNSLVLTLSNSYASYMNGDNSTIRDGHYVLPIKTKDKSKVLGVVYDISDSGSTTFIEPLEIVEINNAITALRVEENEECRKILKALTALAIIQEKEILNNNRIIAELDFYGAKAQYGLRINGEIAEIGDEQLIELYNARHPLIDEHKVVPNTYILSKDQAIIVISGPNAGGKTVSLKTVGLLVMMNQCGLAIPVSKARLSYFKNIYVDIGDNQSLSDNLSTFSAHMSNIAFIVDNCRKNDLVLLDELGTGTSPKEGEAIALAVTKKLENKECFAMISSHFEALKEYAMTAPHIANSSMIFDEDKLLPTYQFRIGVPGQSYALSVAKRFGLNEAIIKEAEDYLSNSLNGENTRLLNALESKMVEITNLENALLKKQKELDAKEIELRNSEEKIKNQKEHLLEEVELEKQQIIEETKEKIQEIMDSLNQDNIKLHQVVDLKKQIEQLEKEPTTVIYNEEINVDDYVSVPALNIEGFVKRINGKKAHIVSSSGIAFDVSIDKLHKIDAPKKQKPTANVKNGYRVDNIVKNRVELELNLIGLRVSEAQSKLERYIDDCRLLNYHSVRIIHGFGSGALRKMVRAYLDEQDDLTYRPGDMYEGGGGATVVIFNDR